MSQKPQRHRWDEPNRLAQKTERECLRGCRTIKVTMHPDGREGRNHWIEYWRDDDLIGAKGRAPVCEPVETTTKEAEICP
jgi:hypothetical protein